MAMFTLYPHGAFMLCEDASEFDPNVQPPVVITPPLDQAIDNSQKFFNDDSPVDKIRNKSIGIYTNIIKPLLVLGYAFNPENPDTNLAQLDNVMKSASNVVHFLRNLVVKVHALNDMWNTGVAYESIKNNLGFLMRNIDKIKKDGYDSVDIPTIHSSICGTYDFRFFVRKLISLVSNDISTLGTILYSTTLAGIIDGFNESDIGFTSLPELIRCFYEDENRFRRFQTTKTVSGSIRACMTGLTYVPDKIDAYSDDVCTILNLLSNVLKYVSQTAYDLQCRIIDHEINQNDYDNSMKKILCMILNIYIIAILDAISEAYEIDHHIAEAVSYSTRIEEILKRYQKRV